MPDVHTPDLRAVLDDADTIAIVGCSSTPTRHKIARYLQSRGY
ncbi:MAG: CoA-binding protein, partial [Bacteroidetes bacterium QS_1_63_11]